MAHLVALDLPGGPAFVTGLGRVWDRGDAVFPLDQRLPGPARTGLLSAMRPASILGADGRERAWDGGQPDPVAPDDALVVATSGTTGPPKGVVLTHDAVGAHARAVHARLGVDRAGDRWLACLPLSHMGGLGVVARAVVDDVGLDVLDGFDPVAVAGAPGAMGSTLTSLVPTALDRLDARPYRWVVLGGSSDDRADRPANVVRTYGLTETGGGVVYDGRPLDGVEVRIVDGEVQLRGPMLLRRYRDGTDPCDADGWLPTGDQGTIDADGRLRVEGRRSELIITGGENVWPTAVEAVLSAHPGVAEVAVAGRPDPEWGQAVVAYVVPRAGAQAPDLASLRAAAREHLPAYAAPRHLVLVEALPRTTLGKVRRDSLT